VREILPFLAPVRSGFGGGLSSSTVLRVTPAKRLNGCQRILKMGLEQLREPSWLDGYTSDCTHQVSIVPRGGLPVCDGRYRCL
jgi:hypothetical protein